MKKRYSNLALYAAIAATSALLASITTLLLLINK